MKHSQWSKLLSLLLVLAMLVQMMPVMSLADDDDLPSFSETAPESAVVTVMGEAEELREENVKHFRLSDGTFVAVNYGMAVHYEDSDGNWQDIDNTISQSAATHLQSGAGRCHCLFCIQFDKRKSLDYFQG